MNKHYPFVNPPLPYAYDALEPYIGKQTLYQHHDKILQQYFMNLNSILSIYPGLQIISLEELLSNAENLPEEIRQSVINNASVIYNHLIYFNGMSNPSDYYHTTYLYPAIIRSFGSVEQFLTKSKEMRCLYLVLATCGSFLTLTVIYKLSQLPTRVLS